MRARSLTALLSCLAACAALAFALTTSGCGSASATLDPVAQAADATLDAGGAHIALAATVGAPGLSAPITLNGEGFFNYKSKEGLLTLKMAGLPASAGAALPNGLELEERIKSTTIFVGSSIFDGKLPGGARWMKLDLARFGQAAGLDFKQLTGGQSNPAQLLAYLKASSGGVTTVGHERVRGVETTLYRGKIDLKKIIDQSPVAQRSQMRAALDKLISQIGVSQLPVDVWVDSQGRVRRFAFSLTVTVQGQTVSTKLTVELFHFGPTPAVAIPAASETYDATQTALSFGKAG